MPMTLPRYLSALTELTPVASKLGRWLVTGSDAPIRIPNMSTVFISDSPAISMLSCCTSDVVLAGFVKELATDQNHAAKDTCLSTEGSGVMVAKLIGAPGSSYCRVDGSADAWGKCRNGGFTATHNKNQIDPIFSNGICFAIIRSIE